MNWRFLDRFFVRPDHVRALYGLRGLGMLLFFQFSFFAQFDPAKLGRIAGESPERQALLGLVNLLLAPGPASADILFVLAGFFLCRSEPGMDLGAYADSRIRRMHPAWLVAVLPMLSYTGAGWSAVAAALCFEVVPEGGPKFAGYLYLAFWLPMGWCILRMLCGSALPFAGRLAIFALCLLAGRALVADQHLAGASLGLVFGLAAGRWPERAPAWLTGRGAGVYLAAFFILSWLEPVALHGAAAPLRQAALALAVLELVDGRGRTTQLLAHPALCFFGVTALSFFILHTTWGFRLSRSILGGEMVSLATIGAHYLLSFAIAAASAALVWTFFERPALLRKGANAGTSPRPIHQGAAP